MSSTSAMANPAASFEPVLVGMLALFAGLAIEWLCVERLRAPDEPRLPGQGAIPLRETDARKKPPEGEQKRIHVECGEINKTPGITRGLPLGLPTLAKTVRASDGRAQVTDGPYLDAGRAVGGYFVFEADDLNAALRLASRSPAARLGSAVEVRPVAK